MPNKQIQSQNSGNQDNTSGITKDNVLESIFRSCESKGAIRHVDDNYYNAFINLSERQMIIFMKVIIRDHAKLINKIVFDPNRVAKDKDLDDMINSSLHWISRGVMGFENDHEIVLYKPVGKPPNREMEKKISQKIENSKPLIREAFKEIFEKQKKHALQEE